MSAFAKLFQSRLYELEHPTPPTYKGSRWNQERREGLIAHWHYMQTKRKHWQPMSPEERERRAFGSWRGVVIAERGEAANAVRVGKAQAAMRYAKAKAE